jgi:hypothetical protein
MAMNFVTFNQDYSHLAVGETAQYYDVETLYAEML